MTWDAVLMAGGLLLAVYSIASIGGTRRERRL
jgi:hypothetical protein